MIVKPLNDRTMARIKNIPQVIYLQEGVEESPEFEEDIDFYDLEEISWSTDRIHSNDLVYYHENTVNELLETLEQVLEQANDCTEDWEYTLSFVDPELIEKAKQAIKKAKGG